MNRQVTEPVNAMQISWQVTKTVKSVTLRLSCWAPEEGACTNFCRWPNFGANQFLLCMHVRDMFPEKVNLQTHGSAGAARVEPQEILQEQRSDANPWFESDALKVGA